MCVNFDVWHLDFLCSPVLIELFEAFTTGFNKSRWLACWHAALSCCWTDHSELRLSSVRGAFCFILTVQSVLQSFTLTVQSLLQSSTVFYASKSVCV